MEPYLDNISDRKYKIALNRFRLSSHNLDIERRRYHSIPRIEGKCKFSPLGFIENEYHFLLVCPKYNDTGRQVLKPLYCSWATINKSDILIPSVNKKRSIAPCQVYIFCYKKKK